jgi:hypothetical protein
METIWKDIVGYEGLYQVSNKGDIKSLSRIVDRGILPSRIQKEKILKKTINTKGYCVVNLTKDKKQNVHSVHSLVALSFIGDRKGLDTNHMDGNKQNNCLDNLEYVSRRENTCHGKSRKHTFPGIAYRIRTKKWVATPVLNGRIHELGYYNDKEQAISRVMDFYKENNIVNKYV